MNIVVLAILLCVSTEIVPKSRQAVTYEQSPGRFGDNLLSYIHAKWIAYKNGITVLYKPFVYSDQLMLHEFELLYHESDKNKFNKVVVLGKNKQVNPYEAASVLYFVPYFPESKWELKNCKSFTGGAWDYFEIDWCDTGFIAELKKVIAPRKPKAHMSLPADRITVAIHLRKGGNHDTPETLPGFPLKFLHDEFYIQQLKELYILLQQQPLYVYLFTDDNHPEKLMAKFKDNLKGLAIEFDCRRQGNSDRANVLEDFFALQQFDCLIHSESNYSFIASKLGNYMVSMYPDSFHKEQGRIVYDHINVAINKAHQKLSNLE